jgi:hypothetical protein
MNTQAMEQAVDYLRLARDYGIALGIGNTAIDDAIRDLRTAIADAAPIIPAGMVMVPEDILRQLKHYTICHLMNFPSCGAPTEAEIDSMLAAAPKGNEMSDKFGMPEVDATLAYIAQLEQDTASERRANRRCAPRTANEATGD